jgi:hypothetical protein
MPDRSHEAACTAAIDLMDVRCARDEHPHPGSHHRTLRLEDGTFVQVFWSTPRTPDADAQMDSAMLTSRPGVLEDDTPPERMPPRLRRSDYARLSVAGGQVLL